MEVDPKLAAEIRKYSRKPLPESGYGLMIYDILQNSPSFEAGLRKEDIIIGYDEEVVDKR